MIKRFLDILCSGLALLFFLPVGIPIAIILRLTGEGYVFYTQERVGENGLVFGLLKFATMLKNSPNMAGAFITSKNDPRVLPLGRFLRKTKLNEVPQLINILIGDMSIVGPRPQVPKHLNMYPEALRKEVIKIKPGLTGIGSIVFRDEENILEKSKIPKEYFYARSLAPFKADLEIWYIKNQSPWLDIKLIFLTAWVVLFPQSKLYRRILKDLPKSNDPLLSFL